MGWASVRLHALSRSLLLAHVVACGAVAAAAAQPAADDATAMPPGSALLLVEAPHDAAIAIDDRDFGEQRRFTFDNLAAHQLEKHKLRITFPNGGAVERDLLVQEGRRIRLAARSPSAAQVETVLQTGHAHMVESVDFRADGRYVLTGSADGNVILWDANNGRQLRAYRAEDNAAGNLLSVNDVAFSSNGRLVAAATGDTARVWELSTGRPVGVFRSDYVVECVAFSPDDKRLALGGWDSVVQIRRLSDGIVERKLPATSGAVFDAAFSPNGKLLAVVGGPIDGAGEAILWDVETGARVSAIGEHPQHVCRVAFSPDGKQLALVDNSESGSVWDAATGELVRRWESCDDLLFLPDGRTLLAAYDSGLGRVATSDASPAPIELDTVAVIDDVALRGDGRLAVTNIAGNSAAIWDVANGSLVQSLVGQRTYAHSMAYDGARAKLAVSGWKRPVEWDLMRGALGDAFDGAEHQWPIGAVCYSPDGRFLVAASGVDAEGPELAVWDTTTRQRVKSLSPIRFQVHAIAFSPDGRWLATAGGTSWLNGAAHEEAELILWDFGTGEQRKTLAGHSSWLAAVEFSPDGRRLASGGWDGRVVVWDTESGKSIGVYEDPNVGLINDVAYNQAGNEILVSTSSPGVVSLDAESAAVKRHWDLADAAPGGVAITSIARSPDDAMIAAAFEDGSAVLFDARNSAPLRTVRADSSPIGEVSFVADGRLLAVSSEDGSVRLWDVATGDLLIDMVSLAEGREWVVTSPAGLFDGSAAGREGVNYRVGGELTVAPVDRFFQDFYRPGLLASIYKGERPLPVGELGRQQPPTIRIIAPDRGGVVQTRTVSLEIEATDTGGGVRGPWLMHNGARVLVDAETNRRGRSVNRRLTVPLVEGENRIEIRAACADGSWESEPEVISFLFEQPLAHPQLHVLAIGVDNYPQRELTLTTARRDAAALAELFRQRGSDLYERVHVSLLFDDAATRAGILHAIESVGAVGRPQDTMLVFLAGHGMATGDVFGFVPFDSELPPFDDRAAMRRRLLTSVEIGDAMAKSPALKRMLVVDSCHSKAPALTRQKSRDPFALRGAIERLGRMHGAYTLVAADATGGGGMVDGAPYSALTYSLLAALRAVDAGPLAGDWLRPGGAEPVAHVLEWFTYAATRVPRLTSQTSGAPQPVQSYSGGASFPVLPVPVDDSAAAVLAHLDSDAADDEGAQIERTETTVAQGDASQGGVLHVLAVGVDRYREPGLSLEYAAADAEAIGEMFRDHGRRLFSAIRVNVLTNALATRAGVEAALRGLAQEATAEDTVVVFLAGHGAMVGQRYFFIPQDFQRRGDSAEEDLRAQGLAADFLADVLADVAARQRVLVVDTCASGGALGITAAPGETGPFAFRGAIDRLSEKQGVFTIAASAASQQAEEVRELGHGVLTYTLLAGLNAVDSGPLVDRGIQPASPDGAVEVLEWLSYAAGHVPRLAEQLAHGDQEVHIAGQGASFAIATAQ